MCHDRRSKQIRRSFQLEDKNMKRFEADSNYYYRNDATYFCHSLYNLSYYLTLHVNRSFFFVPRTNKLSTWKR